MLTLGIMFFSFVFFSDVDDWCLELQSEYPMDLVTAPPPVEKTTVVHSGSCKLHSCIVLVIFLLLQFRYSFILTL